MSHSPAQSRPRFSALEKQIQEQALYYETLGRFIEAFSAVETAMALTLWKYARTSKSVSRAVFSGVRAKEAGDYIKRILEARGATKAQVARFKHLTDQLGELTSARNDIVHFGAQSISNGRAFVTNALKSHLKERTTNFQISPRILTQMTNDLVKITLHLEYEHLDRQQTGRNALASALLAHTLQAPWQYKLVRQRGVPKPDRGLLDLARRRKRHPNRPQSFPA